MRLRLLCTISLAMVCPASAVQAQVVLQRNGELPPPSVAPADYPAMVACTLKKRGADIEAVLTAREDLFQATPTAELLEKPLDYGSLIIATSDGRQVPEARMIIDIVSSCRELRTGYPLGFWPDQLHRDWGQALGVEPQRYGEADFAACLSRYRPALVEAFLAARTKAQRTAAYAAFFTQRVCRADFPLALKESRVRKALQQTAAATPGALQR